MRHEYTLSRSRLKGYLFEIIIMELLLKNHFTKIDAAAEPNDRVRENRQGFTEIKGRGCWHQIDCPCDYSKSIPFTYPLRLLGEVKFYKAPLEKKHIREYIGVIKDIQENYFVADGMMPQDFYPRKMEVGVYFSANGFQAEAEKLAYAHGIKTISYKNNYLVDKLKKLVEELEQNYLSVQCMKDDTWNDFRKNFIEMLHGGQWDIRDINRNVLSYFEVGYEQIIQDIRSHLVEINTSFIATTATGVFLHFIGEDPFPEELFYGTDAGRCRVFYNTYLGNRIFWLEISNDRRRRRFYFTPPESLDYAAVFGRKAVLNEKERLFGTLNVSVILDGISRNLTLYLDENWMNAKYAEWQD